MISYDETQKIESPALRSSSAPLVLSAPTTSAVVAQPTSARPQTRKIDTLLQEDIRDMRWWLFAALFLMIVLPIGIWLLEIQLSR